MNDNFENHGFQTPEEGRKPLEQQAMPGQASTNGETQSWQQAQQSRQVSGQNNMGNSPYMAAQYGGGYQNYSAPRPGGPAHGKKKNSKTGLVIGIIAGVVGSVMLGAAVMGAILYPVISNLRENPSSSYDQDQTPAPSQPQGSAQGGEGDADAEIGGSAPVITDYSNPIPEIAESALQSVVGVTALQQQGGQLLASSRGTGFVISSSGYIMTNYHVISGGAQFIVTDHDGTEYEATFVGGDESLDVAVLKIDANLPALALGNSDDTRVGELVVAIGDPAGAGQNLTGTVTVGYVSAVNRELMFNNMRQKFIQMDAAVNPGNSGGPLFNSRGEVIGVVTLKSLVSSVDSNGTAIDTEGIGFAIPINSAIDAAEQIIATGSVQRPGIGIRYTEISEQLAEANNIVPGNLIVSFMSGGTAQQAGLQVGDIIIRCEGQDVTEVNMSDLVAEKQVGDTLSVTVWRNGQEMDFIITIGDVNQMSDE